MSRKIYFRNGDNALLSLVPFVGTNRIFETCTNPDAEDSRKNPALVVGLLNPENLIPVTGIILPCTLPTQAFRAMWILERLPEIRGGTLMAALQITNPTLNGYRTREALAALARQFPSNLLRLAAIRETVMGRLPTEDELTKAVATMLAEGIKLHRDMVNPECADAAKILQIIRNHEKNAPREKLRVAALAELTGDTRRVFTFSPGLAPALRAPQPLPEPPPRQPRGDLPSSLRPAVTIEPRIPALV